MNKKIMRKRVAGTLVTSVLLVAVPVCIVGFGDRNVMTALAGGGEDEAQAVANEHGYILAEAPAPEEFGQEEKTANHMVEPAEVMYSGTSGTDTSTSVDMAADAGDNGGTARNAADTGSTPEDPAVGNDSNGGQPEHPHTSSAHGGSEADKETQALSADKTNTSDTGSSDTGKSDTSESDEKNLNTAESDTGTSGIEGADTGTTADANDADSKYKTGESGLSDSPISDDKDGADDSAKEAPKAKASMEIIPPDGWHNDNATVRFKAELTSENDAVSIESVKAKISQNGAWTDVTDDMAVTISENATVYLLVTDTAGNTYEKNRFIKCFDFTKPTLNASISNGRLSIVAQDNDSGVKAVYVDSYEFTELTNGTVNIQLQKFDAGYEHFSIQALDNAGNLSDIYRIANPYYKDPGKEYAEDPAKDLPQTAAVSPPSTAQAAVTDYSRTDMQGNDMPLTSGYSSAYGGNSSGASAGSGTSGASGNNGSPHGTGASGTS